MANSKISALTSATTPLAGTEVLPIVQSGATVKATVANITGSGLYAGSFTTLASTGDTTLGDASTDTVRINGYAGIGITPSNSIALQIGSTSLLGAGPIGFYSNPTGPSTATTSIRGIVTRADTAAAAFTVANVMQISLSNSTKGAGSTITNQHGAYIVDQTNGTNNYGITSLVSSGATKWNIYASGTASNYFAGTVGIATNAPATYGVPDAQNLVIGQGGANTGITLSAFNTGSSSLAFSDQASPSSARGYVTYNHNGDSLTLRTAGAERVRVDNAGNVGIGATANASAILDAQSTTKGVRMPNMTTAQKNAIALPAAGLMVFDTTLAKLCVYSGAAWQTITSV